MTKYNPLSLPDVPTYLKGSQNYQKCKEGRKIRESFSDTPVLHISLQTDEFLTKNFKLVR